MADVGFAMEAKSDQLNALDIAGYEPVIRIRAVDVRAGDQPVSVYYDGDNNRPWKPSKGMIRILAAAWGRDSDAWVGKYAQIYCDPDVIYAGQKVGGIRIRALSDIDQRGMTFTITINRKKREPYPVAWLNTERPAYPDDKFKAALPKMVETMQAGKMTLDQVIAHCQKTGDLTAEQLAQLEKSAPVHVDDESEMPETTGATQAGNASTADTSATGTSTTDTGQQPADNTAQQEERF